MLLCCQAVIVNAWTNDLESLKDVNAICKLEPEAQCTSAIRIGLNAPGVDMRNSSMRRRHATISFAFICG